MGVLSTALAENNVTLLFSGSRVTNRSPEPSRAIIGTSNFWTLRVTMVRERAIVFEHGLWDFRRLNLGNEIPLANVLELTRITQQVKQS
jgi:hypothetical protein